MCLVHNMSARAVSPSLRTLQFVLVLCNNIRPIVNLRNHFVICPILVAANPTSKTNSNRTQGPKDDGGFLGGPSETEFLNDSSSLISLDDGRVGGHIYSNDLIVAQTRSVIGKGLIKRHCIPAWRRRIIICDRSLQLVIGTNQRAIKN